LQALSQLISTQSSFACRHREERQAIPSQIDARSRPGGQSLDRTGYPFLIRQPVRSYSSHLLFFSASFTCTRRAGYAVLSTLISVESSSSPCSKYNSSFNKNQLDCGIATISKKLSRLGILCTSPLCR